jgi:FixJ family two-component response regulator
LPIAVASGGCVVNVEPTLSPDLASDEGPIVYVVDDDEAIRRSLSNLFQSVSLRVRTFGSALELLQTSLPDVPSCLVLDIRLPGVSGLDFQAELAKANVRVPIIFMTGHGDIPMTVKAMKAGAIDFLTKPFRQQEILDAVATAINHDRRRRKDEQIISNARALFDTLTPRERDVLVLVAAGLMNKQIAAEIGIAEITVKIHRGHIMRKMRTKSLADLVRITERLGSIVPNHTAS